MPMKKINNTINKKFILDNVNQVEVFSRYFSIPEDDIQECIDTNSLIISPIRLDTNPSVGFRYNNKNVLKMRDFGGFFWGDMFDAVAYILSAKGRDINIKRKEDFKYVLNRIAVDFGVINGVKEENVNVLINRVKHTKKIITVEPRSWNSYDKRYWIHKHNELFDVEYLSSEQVYPVERYWINSYSQPEPKYYYTSRDPCYAYYLGQDKNGIPNIKLYFPKRRKDTMRPRFISNNNVFQGLLNLKDNYDYVVLIKSYKDALVLRRMFDLLFFTGNLDILVIAYPSENYLLNDKAVDWIYSKLREEEPHRIINFTDFDRAGRKIARYVNETYSISYVFLTNGEFGLPNHGCKDISEFLCKYGVSATHTIVNEFIKNYIYGKESYDENTPF